MASRNQKRMPRKRLSRMVPVLKLKKKPKMVKLNEINYAK